MRICVRTRVMRLMSEHTRTHMRDCTYTGLGPRDTINQVNQQVKEASKVTEYVTIWKLGRTVCVYSMVQRREEKDSRYIQEASGPATVPCIRRVTCLRHKYSSNRIFNTSTE